MLSDEIIYQTIFEVYKKCKIDKFPIDCFKVLDTYGIKYKPYSSKEYHSLSDDAFIVKRAIFYNSTMYERRILFTIMHEFAHFILNIPDDGRENENDADNFASCFLAPRILIHYLLPEKNANTIHDYFGLSYAASNNALMSYKKWYEKISSQHYCQANEPERKLYELFKPEEQIEKKLHVRKPEASVTSTIRDDLSENAKKQILRNQKERRKLKRQMAQNEKRVQFLEEIGYDFFAAAENEWLYGGL